MHCTVQCNHKNWIRMAAKKNAGRKTAQSAGARRDRILDAALKVFVERGYEGTSMDGVADEAGVARRTVYNQFPEGKESLFRMVVTRVWTGFPIVDITTDADAMADPEVGLHRIGMAVAEFWAPPLAVGLLRMAIGEGPRFPDMIESFFKGGKAPALNAIVKYIRSFAKSGVLQVSDPELATHQFLGLINEPLLWHRVIGLSGTPKAADRKKTVESAVKLFINYYRR
jgi:AcrR family transcriptional regulator